MSKQSSGSTELSYNLNVFLNMEPCRVVIRNYAYCLSHVPDLVCYGSKPQREIDKEPEIADRLRTALRNFAEAAAYPPNQTFIGNLSPEELANLPRPWFSSQPDRETTERNTGKFGEIIDQLTFLALLKRADGLTPPLFAVEPNNAAELHSRLTAHPLLHSLAGSAFTEELINGSIGDAATGGLPLFHEGQRIGTFYGDQRSDAKNDVSLTSPVLLENLCTKASGALALQMLLEREKIEPDRIDFLISCGEEACGDRYQRGGGGMAKTIGEMCGCVNASGMDVKNFCAAPASALITAAAMVKSGIHERIVVVGGGSLAKLGMKFQAFLEHEMPILDDCLASMAFLITRDDGVSPIIRLEPGAVGKVPIGAATSDEAVFRNYLLTPLENLGLKCTDIDKYAPELQNPEIMEFAGSGDVAHKNYRKIAAMAVRAGQLDKGEMNAWIKHISMPGFAPTQGHIPSAVPYVGHAAQSMRAGKIKRAMFLARASLFLNRCTHLLDGVSFILERNPGLD